MMVPADAATRTDVRIVNEDGYMMKSEGRSKELRDQEGDGG